MGLDMYLQGRKSIEKETKEDGYPVQSIILDLGYWRKHPDLHGFMVQEFAEGEDGCQKIYLSIADLKKTIQAVKARKLPKTEGFFFGESRPEDEPETIEILEKALAWLENEVKGEIRVVYYRASW